MEWTPLATRLALVVGLLATLSQITLTAELVWFVGAFGGTLTLQRWWHRRQA